ncbi:MAG: DUF2812 domain-containing protein [Oscillospiraceae bacterium]|nr:DUF2812 domain-containing protein [Oscillospiraceae bacterium]
MAKKTYHLPPCPSYDVERLESWLQDMAKEGLVLEPESECFGLFGFTPTTPQNLRYRLQPKPENDSNGIAPDQEARDIAAEFGWEFVDSYGHFYIYRSSDPHAREMDTDLEIQSTALKTVKQGFSIQLLSEFISILVTYNLLENAGLFRFLISLSPIYSLALVLLPVSCIASILLRAVHVCKLQRKLKEHTPLNHNLPWKPGIRANWIRRLASLGILALSLAVVLNACSLWIEEDTPLSQYPGDAPFVTLSDMAEEYQSEDLFDFYNTYEASSTPLAETVLDWREYANIRVDGKAYSGAVLIVNYFDTASPWLAERLAHELLRDARQNRYYSELETPELDVDFCAAYTKIWPTILIRQGNIVIEASVNITNAAGESLFTQWAQLQAARMKEGE